MAGRTLASRVVVAEALDGMTEGDPAAQRSRRDLRRIHRAMRSRAIVGQALRDMLEMTDGARLPVRRPLRVLELGAGDGTLMLGVARTLAAWRPAVELTLLDRQALVERSTIDGYAACGWTATPCVVDVLEWAVGAPHGETATVRWDMIVANLFLHHFEGPQLDALLAAIEARTARFFASEPRRAALALVGSRLVGVLGANAVTRADAVLSVRAGFRGSELSALWPRHANGWRLHEYPAGLFSHCLRAERSDPLEDATAPSAPLARPRTTAGISP
jgi:hypothetical protein